MPTTGDGARALRLYIIDGYSLLFRAYLTPGPYMSTADGRPTGAVRGLANMLITLVLQEKPDAICFAWDAPGPTFRDEMYAEYKANRPEAEPDLRQQFPVARQLVEAMGIPSAEQPGFEADDVIGTLASQARTQGWNVVIVTGDSDQLQLVRPGVVVRMTRTGVTDMDLYDEDRVRERYGIDPPHVADFKALVGDSSDNIPGVPGVGKVTAAKLLQEFGSLENLLEHAGDLPERTVRDRKIKDALVTGAAQARMALSLSTIRCDAPIPETSLVPYEPTDEVWRRTRDLFTELEFRTLIGRLPTLASAVAANGTSVAAEAPAAEPTMLGEVKITAIGSDAELATAVAEARAAGTVALAPVLAPDPPGPAGLAGLAFACNAGGAWYVAIDTGAPRGLFDHSAYRASVLGLAGLLADPTVVRVAHDGKTMLTALQMLGVSEADLAFDTAIAAYLLQPGRSGYPIADLADEYLGVVVPAEPVSVEMAGARDAVLALLLREPMQARLDAQSLTAVMQQVEMPLVPILAEIEGNGVTVDRAWLEGLSAEMALSIADVSKRIYELAGEEFLIGSTQQLQHILFEKLQLPAGKKTRTGYSTRADHLESLASEHEIAARVLEYRELTKLKSTYADALPRLISPKTGRIHTSLNQTVTATGRLSSSDPNLQNIPVRSDAGREIRKAFVAPPGQVLLSCDYSQIELRVFAHVTQDPEMVRAFAADEDIHAATATRLFGVSLDQVTPEMRRRAKTVNFAVIYGQSDFGLANTLGIRNEEAREFIASYFAHFPGVRQYTEETIQFAREQGYVQTLLGRRRYLPEVRTGNHNVRQAAERAAVNMPIQGTAADIMKLAMIDVHQRVKGMCYNCTLLLQVHDELVFAVDAAHIAESARTIVDGMEHAFALSVRLKVDAKVGANWAEMSPLAL